LIIDKETGRKLGSKSEKAKWAKRLRTSEIRELESGSASKGGRKREGDGHHPWPHGLGQSPDARGDRSKEIACSRSSSLSSLSSRRAALCSLFCFLACSLLLPRCLFARDDHDVVPRMLIWLIGASLSGRSYQLPASTGAVQYLFQSPFRSVYSREGRDLIAQDHEQPGLR
jgi:hypothetical protein